MWGNGAGARAMIARWRGARRAAVLRAVAAVLLALVLAGVSVQRARPAGGSCVILAVDVSASVRHAGLDAAARLLPALGSALGPHDVVGAIVFAGEARVAAPPASAAPTAQALAAAAEESGIDRDASDLSAAIRLAVAALSRRTPAGAAADQRRPGDAGQRARGSDPG